MIMISNRNREVKDVIKRLQGNLKSLQALNEKGMKSEIHQKNVLISIPHWVKLRKACLF